MDRVRKFQRERDVREARFRAFFALSLIVIASAAFILNSMSNARRFPDPIKLKVFSLDEVYPTALEKVVEWNSDAYLVDASFKFRLTSDSMSRWAGLEFRSRSAPRELLDVFVTEASDGLKYELSLVEDDGKEPLRDPITPETLAIDAGEALEISLWNGGNEYIQEVGDSMLWPQNLKLRYRDHSSETDIIVWRVSYFSPYFGPGIWVEIDAETGEILETS